MQKVVLLPPPPEQIARSGLAALNVTDLTTAFHNEPRVHDLLLAERLGFKRLFDIREMIGRNRAELESFGAIVHQASMNGGPISDPNIPYGTVKSRRGRPTKEYWLNEGQALTICALSRTSAAARIRRELITVFMAFRVGELVPAVHVEPQVGELAAIARTMEAMRGEVNTLRRSVGSLLERIDQQGRALKAASAKQIAGPAFPGAAFAPVRMSAGLLYGARAIGNYIGLRERQVHGRVTAGELPVFRMGKTVCSTTVALDAWLERCAAQVEGRA